MPTTFDRFEERCGVLRFVLDVLFWIAVGAFAAWRSTTVFAEQPPFDPKKGLGQERSGLLLLWAAAPLTAAIFAMMFWSVPYLDAIDGFLWPMLLILSVLGGAAVAGFRVPAILFGATVAAMLLISAAVAATVVVLGGQGVLSADGLRAVGQTLIVAGAPGVAAFMSGWLMQRFWQRQPAPAG